MPAGAKLQYDGAPDSIAEELVYMSFDDVKPVADIDFSKADSAVFRTFDGLEVTANIAMADKATWVKFEAKALPGAEHPEAADETKSADDAASKDKDQAKDKAKPKPLDVPAELLHAAELARMLVRHLGIDGAAKTCRENHWDGVLSEVMGQASAATTP